MMDEEMRAGAARLLELLRRRGLTIVLAESCTGGLIAAALTEVPGSSDVVDRGFVTYSNRAKEEMVGLLPSVLESYGAVSKETALAMARGALDRSPANIAVAVTGIAGPAGGSPEKPVGLVHLAAVERDGTTGHRECRFGAIGRDRIRRRSLFEAFALVEELLSRGRRN